MRQLECTVKPLPLLKGHLPTFGTLCLRLKKSMSRPFDLGLSISILPLLVRIMVKLFFTRSLSSPVAFCFISIGYMLFSHSSLFSLLCLSLDRSSFLGESPAGHDDRETTEGGFHPSRC